MSVHPNPFHSLLLKLSNKRMSFPITQLNSQTKKMKNILKLLFSFRWHKVFVLFFLFFFPLNFMSCIFGHTKFMSHLSKSKPNLVQVLAGPSNQGP